MTAPAAAPPAGGRLLSLAAVIATAAIFGLTYSLSAALIALDLAGRGVTESVIGLNAAMHALGVLAIAPVLPRVAGLIGARRLTLGALVLAGLVLALFPAMPAIWLWFPLRMVLGAASESLFTLSETWVNQLSEERTRARSMATYVAALSTGFALGPLILSAVGTAGASAYLIGTGLALAAALLIADRLAKSHRPGLSRGASRQPAPLPPAGADRDRRRRAERRHRDGRAVLPAALCDRPRLDRGGRHALDILSRVRPWLPHRPRDR